MEWRLEDIGKNFSVNTWNEKNRMIIDVDKISDFLKYNIAR